MAACAYGLVREHLATFLAYTEATYSLPLPLVGSRPSS
jgi:hypothetical protein